MTTNFLLSHRNHEPELGVLYIVGTPIGNLEDISFRALNILKNVFFIACEDTRQTKKIMNRFNINNKLISFNQNNSNKKIPHIISNLKEGNAIAMVSDAGMPGICDPGEELIKKAKIEGIDVICIPGACAALTALVSSGFSTSKFIFEGFLPKKKSTRIKILYEINNNTKTTILFESPHRLLKTLKELRAICGGCREIEISRELTKKFEEHVGSNLDEVINYFEGEKVLGEITIVIKGIDENNIKREINKGNIKSELHELVSLGLTLSAASKYLAKRENLTKNFVYKLY